jgi:hypothetical protein
MKRATCSIIKNIIASAHAGVNEPGRTQKVDVDLLSPCQYTD